MKCKDNVQFERTGTWGMSMFSGFPHHPSRFLQLAQVFAAELGQPFTEHADSPGGAAPRSAYINDCLVPSRFSVRWYLLEIKPAPGKLKVIHAIKGTGGSDYE